MKSHKELSPKAKKRQEKKDIKKAEQTAKKDLVADIAPIIAGNKRENFFYLEDGTLMDFFRIVCKDLLNMSSDNSMMENLCWDKFFKTTEDAIKIVAFNFPTDTKQQLEYARYKSPQTENPVYKKLLEQRIYEDTYISENRTDKEFCLFFYAKNAEMLREKRAAIYGLLSSSLATASLVERLEYDKKLKILYKLFNSVENL